MLNNLFSFETQYILIKRLKSYVSLLGHQENYELLAFLEKCQGLCFGLSLCRGAMQVMGLLDWWNAALFTLISWSGTPQTLQQIVVLPQETQANTLDTLFQRILNYLITLQGTYLSNDKFKCFDQLKFLKTKNNSFLMVVQDSLRQDQIKKIEHVEAIAGHFSTKELNYILTTENNAELGKDYFIMIVSRNHACMISKQQCCWSFYDSDYKVHQAKKFNTLAKMTADIISSLGSDLALLAITLDRNINLSAVFKNYYTLLKMGAAPQLIKGNALTLIAKYCPQLLTALQAKNELAPIQQQLNQVGKTGFTPLGTAIQYSNSKRTITTFINNGANVNCVNKEQESAIELATRLGKFKIAEYLRRYHSA